MSSFLERLKVEKDELSDKIEKLTLFTQSDNFKRIEILQQSLLRAQLLSMKSYEGILIIRLENLQ